MDRERGFKMKSTEKIVKGRDSLIIIFPGGEVINSKNAEYQRWELEEVTAAGFYKLPEPDSLYYPLFPARKNLRELYKRAHDRLMGEMRKQTRLKNRSKIEQTGKKLHSLRQRYRARFAA